MVGWATLLSVTGCIFLFSSPPLLSFRLAIFHNLLLSLSLFLFCYVRAAKEREREPCRPFLALHFTGSPRKKYIGEARWREEKVLNLRVRASFSSGWHTRQILRSPFFLLLPVELCKLSLSSSDLPLFFSLLLQHGCCLPHPYPATQRYLLPPIVRMW